MIEHKKFLLLCSLYGIAQGLQAELTLDGSLGASGAITPVNNTYTIDSTAGNITGSNLFHSFARFNLETGATAHFSDSTQTAIANVIARVTGGSLSVIDGTIRSSIPDADLYLLNPAGLLFGPNAQLDIPGSFHASTASYLTFQDGGRFDASQPGNDVLTSAPPQAFGFLESSPLGDGNIDIRAAELAVGNGEKMDFSAGNIHVEESAVLTARAGEIRLVAMRGTGEVSLLTNSDHQLSLPETAPASTTQAGEIRIQGNSEFDYGGLNSSGNGGGRIGLWGEHVVLKDGLLDAINTGNTDANASQGIELRANRLSVDDVWVQSAAYAGGDGGVIKIEVNDSLELENGAQIRTETNAGGQAGGVTVKAGSVLVDRQDSSYNTGILSLSYDSGDSGNVIVEAEDQLALVNGGEISSESDWIGQASQIRITAGSLLIDGQGSADFTGVRSTAYGLGDASVVLADIRHTASIVNGGEIKSYSDWSGQAGGIELHAESLLIDSQSSGSFTGILAKAFDTGNTGKVIVQTSQSLNMVNGGQIRSETDWSGQTGGISVNTGSLLIDGQASDQYTGIQSLSYAAGDTGHMLIESREALTIRNGGQITSFGGGSGRAGGITLKAGTLQIDRQGSVDSTGIRSVVTGVGDGGNMLIDSTNGLEILNGGGILSASSGLGDAAGIAINAGSLRLDKQFSTYITGISMYTGAEGSGQSGALNIHSNGTMAILNGATITSNSLNSSDSASISIGVDTLNLQGLGIDLHSSEIATLVSLGGTGEGGRIDISTQNATNLSTGGIIQTYTDGIGKAGDLNIAADNLSIQGNGLTTGIFSASRPGSLGASGHVSVQARNSIAIDSGGSIDTGTNNLSDAGSITLQAEQLTLSDGNISTFTTETSSGNGGDIRLDIKDLLAITRGGDLNTASLGTGNAGDIAINAGNILIDTQGKAGITGIHSDALKPWSGQGGNISLHADNQVSINGGGVTSFNNGGFGSGSIDIAANELVISRNGLIAASTLGTGKAGDIFVNTERLTIDGQNQITGIDSSTLSPTSGPAGNIWINADTLGLSGLGFIATDSFSSNAAGNIVLGVNQVNLSNGGNLSSTALNSGAAGTIRIFGRDGNSPAEQVVIDGVSDNTLVLLPNGREVLGTSSGIFLNSAGSGNGGQLELSTQQLAIRDGGEISAITAFGATANTRGGSIDIVADTIDLSGGGLISTNTAGKGTAGNINVSGTNSILITGSFDRNRHSNFTNPRTSEHSGISSAAGFEIDPQAQLLGDSGTVTVATSLLSLTNGAEISAINKGAGNAGTLNITASDRLELKNQSTLTVESSSGNAGDINIMVDNTVYLLNSSITTSAAAGFGNGGNIFIDPRFVILNHSQIIANALQGSGGNINIIADYFLPSADSLISAASRFGLQGSVSIQSQNANIAGSIDVLPNTLLDVSNLLRSDCGAASGNASSFVLGGKGSLPLAPDGFVFQGLQTMQCGVGL